MKHPANWIQVFLVVLLLGASVAFPLGTAKAGTQPAVIGAGTDTSLASISSPTSTAPQADYQTRRCAFTYQDAVKFLRTAGWGSLIKKIFALPTAGRILWCWIQPTPVS
jgi:hypothetical protein